MNNKQLEEIRRKLQSKIKKLSNEIAEIEQHHFLLRTPESARKQQSENKRLMAALIHLQRENKELKEECNLYADSVMRRFIGSNV